MKWYYEWRLNKVRAQITALEAETGARLKDDYTGLSRLRVLKRKADSLQKRLAKPADHSRNNDLKGAH
jgi:hypothetical protein